MNLKLSIDGLQQADVGGYRFDSDPTAVILRLHQVGELSYQTV